jgi:Domain of unknown function (DUF397)
MKVADMRSYETIPTSPLDWHRASFCQTGECVEIAGHNGMVIMRSTQPDSVRLYFTTEEFGSFLREAKAGKFGAGQVD